MSDKLLPCPFCGGEAKLFCEDGGHWVICQSCGSKALTHYDSLYPTTARKRAIAAWNRRVDARQLALKTRVCPMCEDCPDGCPVEMPKDSRNIVTNADRIRSMSDEKLAKIITSDLIGELIPFCQNKYECDAMLTINTIPEEWCMKCALDWLKEEHNEAD